MQHPISSGTYRDWLRQQIRISRQTLLGVVVLTTVSLALLAGGRGTYLPFSVFVSCWLTRLGVFMDQDGRLAATGLALGAAVLAIYLVIWLLSLGNGRWLRVAACLLMVDGVAMAAIGLIVNAAPESWAVELLFHIIAIVQIWKGGTHWKRMQALSQEPVYRVREEDL